MSTNERISSKYADSYNAELAKARKKLEEAELHRHDLELFTNSGSWIYDKKNRTISLNAGACRILGLLAQEKPMALSLLEGMCEQNDRKKLLDFLNAQQEVGIEQSLQIPIQDSYGDTINIVMCTRNSVDVGEELRGGLIKIAI